MHLFSLSSQSASTMLPVLELFLLPVGGGIPAGVLLAQSKGLAWPITTGLYLVSDVVLPLPLNRSFGFLPRWQQTSRFWLVSAQP